MGRRVKLSVKISIFVSMFCITCCGDADAQNAADILNTFGGLLRSATSLAAQAEWKKLAQTELSCIDQKLQPQGSSVQRLIQQGISPSAPQMAFVRSLCQSQLPIQVDQRASTVNQSNLYVVDGLALGGQVKFDSDTYRSYSCVPSEQFAGFTWCQKKTSERVKRGQFSSSYSILHSQDGSALYVNRYLEPAWFAANEASDDINGRSKKYGAPTRFLPMPSQSSVPNGMIVTWGSVTLVTLDPDNVKRLAAGQDVRAGFMIDHIGNYQRSAQQGLPIYRLTGGAGYVWAASWDQHGIGTLRFLAIDASAIASQIPAASNSDGVNNAEKSPSVNADKAAEAEDAKRTAEVQKKIAEAQAAKNLAENPNPASVNADKVAEAEAAKTFAEDKAAKAESAKRISEETAVRKIAEAKGAKQSADAASDEVARYKKQLDEQQARYNYILISIAGVFLGAIGLFFLRRNRKTNSNDNVRGPSVQTSITPRSDEISNSAESISDKKIRDFSPIIAAMEQEIAADGIDKATEKVSGAAGPDKTDTNPNESTKEQLEKKLSIAESNRSDPSTEIIEAEGDNHLAEEAVRQRLKRDKVLWASQKSQRSSEAYDIVDQLAQFAELHANGSLTDEEFRKLKAKLMGQSSTSQKPSGSEYIKQLRSLRDGGVLTDAEFQSKVLASLSNPD
jgi:putative oligomerization/nucleic acid binding protein